jgi:hypothetical protein
MLTVNRRMAIAQRAGFSARAQPLKPAAIPATSKAETAIPQGAPPE